MAEFWLATFKLDPGSDPMQTAAMPLAADATAWAIEVIREDDEFAVLFSTVDNATDPKTYQCRIGFANGCKSCNVWRDRGFPLMDAVITQDADVLRVQSPCFLDSPALNYEVELIRITGAMLDYSLGSPVKPLEVFYDQSQNAPDFAFPATWIRRKPVSWRTTREKVSKLPASQLKLTLKSPRLPSLAPFKGGPATPAAIWAGIVDLPKWPPVFSRQPAVRESRADTFGVPAFRFEDVEVLGFRLDLDNHRTIDDRILDDTLATMVERLNFHVEQSDSARNPGLPTKQKAKDGTSMPAPDFRYRPATRTVMLELLRYGKMKLKAPWLSLSVDDFQSQHELLVRMLVGRVDDDTAQAHHPATFVPTLFVDNPWSKVLGRNVQGFDKRLADFCVRRAGKPVPLRPDGRLLGRTDRDPPVPLADITEIRLTSNTGKRPSDFKLLELDCPAETYEGWENFEEIDFELALGTSSLAPTRWRQRDFEGVEFRRSFARSAISETLKGIRSIQVSPVGEAELRQQWKDETAWITGTFVVDDGALIARPNGIVGLTLHAEPSAPEAWKTLCRLFDIPEGGQGRISLPAGSWYRMRCSMDLVIDDGPY